MLMSEFFNTIEKQTLKKSNFVIFPYIGINWLYPASEASSVPVSFMGEEIEGILKSFDFKVDTVTISSLSDSSSKAVSYIIRLSKEEQMKFPELIKMRRQRNIKKNKCNDFEKVKTIENYYYINSQGSVSIAHEIGSGVDRGRHKVANYCTDKNKMKARAEQESIFRKLWRLSEESGGCESQLRDKNQFVYYIVQNTNNTNYSIRETNDVHEVIGTVYFPSKEVAQRAIDEILEPYFCEKLEEFFKKWEESLTQRGLIQED